LLTLLPALSFASFAAERSNIRVGDRTPSTAIKVHLFLSVAVAVVEGIVVSWLAMRVVPGVLGGDEAMAILMLLALNLVWVIVVVPIFAVTLARTKRVGEAHAA
jgi:hypothetical protein